MPDIMLDWLFHRRIDELITHLPFSVIKYSHILKFIDDHSIFSHLSFLLIQLLGELWDTGIFCAKISGLYE